MARIGIDPQRARAGLAALVALAAALAPGPAPAHERGDRAMGIVESVGADRIAVKAPDGHVVSFRVTRDTRFLRGEAPARPEDVRLGERAVVHGRRAGEELEAVRVKLGPKPDARQRGGRAGGASAGQNPGAGGGSWRLAQRPTIRRP